MTTLAGTIENLYQVFSKYKAPNKLVLDMCYSCITFEDEVQFLKFPLKEIPDYVIGDIISACNVTDFGNPKYKYYIPRILELLTIENYDFSFSFCQYIHEAFSTFNYKSTFKKQEITAIDNFLTAFLEIEYNKPAEDRDEAELFNIAAMGYNPASFLKETRQHKDWEIIKKNLKFYFNGVIEKDFENTHISLFVKTFEQWCNYGERQTIIDFLNKN